MPLDRNEKVRLMARANAYNTAQRQKGQHIGPLTRTTLIVLRALLWGFHNQHTGRCFPSYEAMAGRARCHRDTAIEAIKALEAAGLLTWQRRLVRHRIVIMGLLGRELAYVPRRTSNAYRFVVPREADPDISAKSENPAETQNQDFFLDSGSFKPVDKDSRLGQALIRLGAAIRGEASLVMT